MANHGYLLDMDGVIYRGAQLLPGARQFIDQLKAESIPFLFLTNNASYTRRDICRKLARLDIEVDESHVFTSAMATALFLNRQKPAGTAFVIGEGGLMTALHNNGYANVDHDPDYVVVGESRNVTFEAIERAMNMVINGAGLIGTSPDPTAPKEAGVRPGCGATVAMLEKGAGRQAFFVGKPNPIMMRAARKELELRTEQTIMIGDTMETDILGGIQMGYRTILTLTGGTGPDELEYYPYKPDRVVESLAELDAIELGHELVGEAAEPAEV